MDTSRDQSLDVSTRKLLTLYKCLSINDDVHRLYIPQTCGGHDLLSVEDIVAKEKLVLGRYLESSIESWLQRIYFAVVFIVLNLHQTTRIDKFRKILLCRSPSLYKAYGYIRHCRSLVSVELAL